jgi:LytS/YehU family sensor histidine kinase
MFVIIVVGTVIGKSCGRIDATNKIREANRASVIRANDELNRGLPMMVDSQTMVTKAETTSVSTIYYLKMINYTAAQLGPDFLVNAQESIGRRNCVDSDIVQFYNMGMHMQYIVYGSDNQKVGSFVISKAYCQRFR